MLYLLCLLSISLHSFVELHFHVILDSDEQSHSHSTGKLTTGRDGDMVQHSSECELVKT